MPEIYHALGLHLHQPLGNLIQLHNAGQSWEARQILWCYDRPTRMLEGYEDVARLHLSFSGTLLTVLRCQGGRDGSPKRSPPANRLARKRERLSHLDSRTVVVA